MYSPLPSVFTFVITMAKKDKNNQGKKRKAEEKTSDILAVTSPPPSSKDEKFTETLVCLRQLHSSLSNNGNAGTGTDPALLKDLRAPLQRKIPFCVKLLTRVLEFEGRNRAIRRDLRFV